MATTAIGDSAQHKLRSCRKCYFDVDGWNSGFSYGSYLPYNIKHLFCLLILFVSLIQKKKKEFTPNGKQPLDISG